MDKANREVAPAGPMARMMDVKVWARPVVAPSAEREGTEDVRKIKTAPNHDIIGSERAYWRKANNHLLNAMVGTVAVAS